MRPRRIRHSRINDYPPITMDVLRKGVGGKHKFNSLQFVDVEIPGGPRVRVNIRRRPSPLGKGEIPTLECPHCRGGCTILRMTPQEPFLMCWRCVERVYKVHYMNDADFEHYNVKKMATRPHFSKPTEGEVADVRESNKTGEGHHLDPGRDM